MLEVGTDTKRDNYTPNIESLELVGMNLCSMSICSVFYQWVKMTWLSFVLEK